MPNTKSSTMKLSDNESRVYELERKRKDNTISEKELKEYYARVEKLSRDQIKKEYNERLDKEKELLEIRKENAQEEGNFREQINIKIEEKVNEIRKKGIGNAIAEGAASLANTLTSKLDTSIQTYVSQIEEVSAHLMGTQSTFSALTSNLNSALAGTGIVDQSKVFTNLSNYVKEGIVYNVEQRAFLKSIAEDIHLTYVDNSTALNQIVRLQKQDSTANRLSLQYSLQKFLNKYYEDSEYISSVFTSVSDSLFAAESLMSANAGLQLESVIQTRLGSLYSSGVSQNTISSLANALNSLGSGDISNLGNGISNLVLMGAARAGLDYGSLLNQGITASNADVLLNSIISYMGELNSNSSNVVRSQLSNLFGVQISDLVAASRMQPANGSVSTSAGTLLNDLSSFIPTATKLTNAMNNMYFSWGTSIASNDATYAAYEGLKIIANTLGTILQGVSTPTFGGVLPSFNLGSIAQAAPLIPMLAGLINNLDIVTNAFGNYNSSALAVFDALGGSNKLGNTVKISQAGVSGSAYVSNGTSDDLLQSSMTSINSMTSNVIEQEGPSWEDNVETTTNNIAEILNILNLYMETINTNIENISGSVESMSTSSMTDYASAGGYYNGL